MRSAALLALAAAGCLDYDALHSASDLAGADLAGADLAAVDLAGHDHAVADLANADLAGADLATLDLAQSDLSPPADLAATQACGQTVPSICTFVQSLLCDDFENGLLGNTWMVDTKPANSMVGLEQTDACRGNRAVQLTAAGAAPRIALISQAVPPQNTLYLRAYMSWSAPPKGYLILGVTNTAGAAAEVDLAVDGNGNLALIQGGVVIMSGGPAPQMGWHCIELQVSGNGAGVWVDDMPDGKLFVPLAVGQPDGVQLGLSSFGMQSVDAMAEVDEVVAAFQYVPCRN